VTEEPREVAVTLAIGRSLTVLESARALAVARIRQADAERFLRLFARTDAEPEDLVTATEFLYAIAWQWIRRSEPAVTWDEAQRWRVILDLEEPVDELAEAEARAAVDAAIATGLEPAVAGGLSLRHMDEYRRIHAEREKRAKRGRRARRGA
jgi:hypothetical protein